MNGFSSALAPRIESFLELKRAMGRRYEAAEEQLHRFDRYVAGLDRPPEAVTRELVHGWLTERPDLGPRTQLGRASVLRQLCIYLARTDPHTYVPDRALLPVTLPILRPHIFSEDEVRALVQAARSWSPHGWKPRPLTFSTIVLVLYGTGLRRGEICRLRFADLDLEARTLFVHKTKFNKSRLVPFSAGLTEKLHGYLGVRLQRGPTDRHAPLFITRRRQAFRLTTLSGAFHDLVKAAGIVSAPGRRAPCLHGMRHTFAVHRLLRWYREGADLEAMLPVLATYMGHVNPLSTLVYLNATAELLREASRRFERAYGSLVVAPEEIIHEAR